MNLKWLRVGLIQFTGRHDLIQSIVVNEQTGATDDLADNGANFLINAGIKWIVNNSGIGVGSPMFVELHAYNPCAYIPNARNISGVHLIDDSEAQLDLTLPNKLYTWPKLEKKPFSFIQSQYPNSYVSNFLGTPLETGTPLHWMEETDYVLGISDYFTHTDYKTALTALGYAWDENQDSCDVDAQTGAISRDSSFTKAATFTWNKSISGAPVTSTDHMQRYSITGDVLISAGKMQFGKTEIGKTTTTMRSVPLHYESECVAFVVEPSPSQDPGAFISNLQIFEFSEDCQCEITNLKVSAITAPNKANDRIMVFPPPDRMMMLAVFGEWSHQDLVDDNDSNYITETEPELVIKASIAEMHAMYGNTEQATIFRKECLEGIRRLQNRKKLKSLPHDMRMKG